MLISHFPPKTNKLPLRRILTKYSNLFSSLRPKVGVLCVRPCVTIKVEDEGENHRQRINTIGMVKRGTTIMQYQRNQLLSSFRVVRVYFVFCKFRDMIKFCLNTAEKMEQ